MRDEIDRMNQCALEATELNCFIGGLKFLNEIQIPNLRPDATKDERDAFNALPVMLDAAHARSTKLADDLALLQSLLNREATA